MRDPDLAGHARAWQIVETEALVEAHRKAWGSDPAGIATWIVNGPYHPFWSWWMIGCVHLREQEGVRPALVNYPGATHEIMCLSLDPKTPVDIDKLDAGDAKGGRGPALSPPDWVVQFIVADDAQAEELTRLTVRAICDGMSCDSDYRSRWERIIANTAEHLRLGSHPGEPS